MKVVPKVKFIYAYPLDRQRRELYQSKGLGPYPSIEEVKEKTKEWERLLERENANDRFILEIAEVTKRIPERSLECFVIGGGLNSTSTPFIMSTMMRGGNMSDEQFIDVMIHEIIHIFVVSKAKKYWNMIYAKYADEKPVVRQHIIVYAVLEHAYAKFFNTKPLDYSRGDLPEGYQRAVDIVQERGCKDIVREFQEYAK